MYWRARSEHRSSYPPSTTGFGDVEPLPLPQVGSSRKGALWPSSIGELARHSTAALHLFPINYLRLHIKGLEPQAEVWGNTEEGFAYDNER